VGESEDVGAWEKGLAVDGARVVDGAAEVGTAEEGAAVEGDADVDGEADDGEADEGASEVGEADVDGASVVVGMGTGESVAASVGRDDGDADTGAAVEMGAKVAAATGASDGSAGAADDGAAVVDGRAVVVGNAVGSLEGLTVGRRVGECEGLGVGALLASTSAHIKASTRAISGRIAATCRWLRPGCASRRLGSRSGATAPHHRSSDFVKTMRRLLRAAAALATAATAATAATGTTPLVIDAVYTYVNGSDAAFLAQLLEFADGHQPVAARRFNDHDELRYSLRSLDKFAPWVRHVHLVTNGLPGQIPDWLDTSRVTVHSHADIFAWPAHLPTFSSPAIEMHLHRIPGLAEHFLYVNDDMFFGAPAFPHDFVDAAGAQLVYFSHHMPDCAAGCQASMLGDRFCDPACNVTACELDLGDCEPELDLAFRPDAGFMDGYYDDGDSLAMLSAESEELACSPGCSVAWVADGMCDMACKHAPGCGFDGGDCEGSALPPVVPAHAVRIARPRGDAAFWAVAVNASHVAGTASAVVLESDSAFVLTASVAKSWGRNVVFLLLAGDAEGTLRLGLAIDGGAPSHRARVELAIVPAGDQDGGSWAVPPTGGGANATGDEYGASLVATRRALRRALGRAPVHLVPAHMPHLFALPRLRALEALLSSEAEATSARRLRSGADVQLAFAYFSLLLADARPASAEAVWRDFVDVDGDGCVGAGEMRSLAAMLLHSNASLLDLDPFELDVEQAVADDAPPGRLSAAVVEALRERVWEEAGRPLLAPCMTRSVLEAASVVYSALRRHCSELQRAHAPAFRVLDRDEVRRAVRLVMMGDTASALLDGLDELRARRPKFFTLNDDTVRGFEPAAARALKDFLTTAFPHASRFEKGHRAGLGGDASAWRWTAVATGLALGGALMYAGRA